jgi:hypothetical protein
MPRQTTRKKKKRTPEHDEQVELFNWARLKINLQRWPELALFHSIPNGAPRYGAQLVYYTAEGLTSGIPDTHLPVSRAGYLGLWIEMKHGANKPSEKQLEMIAHLRREGHYVAVCYNSEDAIIVLKAYLEEAETVLKALHDTGVI